MRIITIVTVSICLCSNSTGGDSSSIPIPLILLPTTESPSVIKPVDRKSSATFTIPEFPPRGRMGASQIFSVIENSIPDVVRKLQLLMEEAESVEIWSLDPSKITSPDGAKPDFREFYSIGHAKITDEQVLKSLGFYLALSIAKGPDESAECFVPRHGFRFHAKDRQVDVAICFECSNGEMHDGDEFLWFTTSDDRKSDIDAIFSDFGLIESQ